MNICCNCKKDSMLQLHICPECLKETKNMDAKLKLAKEYLGKAAEILKSKNLIDESKTIMYMKDEL